MFQYPLVHALHKRFLRGGVCRRSVGTVGGEAVGRLIAQYHRRPITHPIQSPLEWAHDAIGVARGHAQLPIVHPSGVEAFYWHPLIVRNCGEFRPVVESKWEYQWLTGV